MHATDSEGIKHMRVKCILLQALDILCRLIDEKDLLLTPKEVQTRGGDTEQAGNRKPGDCGVCWKN